MNADCLELELEGARGRVPTARSSHRGRADGLFADADQAGGLSAPWLIGIVVIVADHPRAVPRRRSRRLQLSHQPWLPPMDQIRAGIVVTGTEVLTARIVDKNGPVAHRATSRCSNTNRARQHHHLHHHLLGARSGRHRGASWPLDEQPVRAGAADPGHRHQSRALIRGNRRPGAEPDDDQRECWSRSPDRRSTRLTRTRRSSGWTR